MMQVSKRALVIIAEATATSAIGLVHAGAGVALTFELALVHIHFDKEVPIHSQHTLVQGVNPENRMREGVEENLEHGANPRSFLNSPPEPPRD